jgi:hypothetical protein
MPAQQQAVIVVRKRKQLLNMEWIYQTGKGINTIGIQKIELFFGARRNETRELLGYDSSFNQGRFENEDSYYNLFGIQDNFIRLGFTEENLSDVEILNGTLIFEEISIKTQSDLKLTLEKLKIKNYHFKETDYSFVNKIVNIDLGDSTKNGGVDNLIHWILIGKDFSYIED